MPLDRASGDRLGVEPQLVVGDAQHPKVGTHVALAVKQRRIAPSAHGHRFDIVGDLRLEVIDRLAPGDDQLRSLGAIDEARRVSERRPVLAVELDLDPWSRTCADSRAHAQAESAGLGFSCL